MLKFLARATAVAGLTVALSAPVFATETTAFGLGQAWPNATDVSSSPHWHVYLFTRNGVRFVQVNDTNGNVRGAFATAGGQFMVLPMGRDAQRIATPQQNADTTAPVDPGGYQETIYKDDSVTVTAVPLSDGTMMFSTAATPCEDLEQCSAHIQ